MSIRRTALAALALLFGSCTMTPAYAQRPTAPNCQLQARVFDNPISDHGGFIAPRWTWHAGYAATSAVTAVALRKAFKVPPWVATLGFPALSLALHTRGIARKTYPFDAGDWAFDLWTRGAPAIVLFGWSGHSWQSRTLSLTTVALGYRALCPYASP